MAVKLTLFTMRSDEEVEAEITEIEEEDYDNIVSGGWFIFDWRKEKPGLQDPVHRKGGYSRTDLSDRFSHYCIVKKPLFAPIELVFAPIGKMQGTALSYFYGVNIHLT